MDDTFEATFFSHLTMGNYEIEKMKRIPLQPCIENIHYKNGESGRNSSYNWNIL